MSSSLIETPIGSLSWDGPLNERTEMTLSDGETVPLYILISQTNGRVLEWLSDAT